MIYLKINGREQDVKVHKYLIDWNDDSLSIFQRKVKNFLYRYWKFHVVTEEFLIPGEKLRIDFLNVTRGIAVECDGGQHNDPKHYYNQDKKNPYKYLDQVKRDVLKDEWCALNKIPLVRIREDEVEDISKEWFFEKYNVNL